MGNIIVLPGTKWQEKLIKELQRGGHFVTVVDPNIECACSTVANNHFCCDIFDLERIEEYIKDNNIDAVMSDECDIATTVIAILSSRIGKPTIGIEIGKLYTDKTKMRDFSRKINLPCPQYYVCKTESEACDAFLKTRKKMVLKPIDCNASRGVYTINSLEDIHNFFVATMNFSRERNEVILEEYIDGIEFTIDGIKTYDKHYTLAISEKRHFAHNENIANELFFSHKNEKYDYEELKKVNDKFIYSSGLKWGFTHAEYKYQNGEFYLIEIAARGGGNMISSTITQYLTGYNTYEYLIGCALGINQETSNFEIRDAYRDKCAVLKFFSLPQKKGIVKEIKGLDFLENNEYVLEYKFNVNIADDVCECESDSERPGFYIAGCDTRSDLEKLMVEIDKSVEIVIE